MIITGVKQVPFVTSLPLGAVLGNTVDLWTKEVPSKTNVRLKKIGNDLNVPANWGLVRWDFFVNGILIAGLDRIYDQLGFGAQRQPCYEAILPSGSLIVVRATNGSPAGVAAAACLVSLSLMFEFEDVG
ncbi:MAG: hypothetical protein MUQ25_03800 [Candidatus Aminicenantes bacterium]|nr:hypothetical protein [Candidatus Aminicenantes bacterium]